MDDGSGNEITNGAIISPLTRARSKSLSEYDDESSTSGVNMLKIAQLVGERTSTKSELPD